MSNNLKSMFLDQPLRVPLEVTNNSSSVESKVILSVISDSKSKSESLIKVKPKSGFAFIQTDKPIYTPKENVLIRMLRLDDRLRPLEEKVKLRIRNSQKIIIEEMTLRSSPPNHYIDHTFEFPPAPKLGIWFAELWYGTNFSSNSSVSFEVKEYVLPTFAIKIRSPKFILESTDNVSGSVRVDYVYGKPVNGTVVFKFGTKAPNGRVNYFGSTGIKQLVNGSAQYHIEANQFRQLPFTWFPAVNGHRFVVEVSANERATGKKDRAIDETALFVQSPYVISYRNTFTDFKPNVETYITAQIFNALEEPVPDLRIKLSLRDSKGQPVRHPNESSQLSTDHLGRISFPVTLDENVKQLHVSIRTDDPNIRKGEQAEAEHLLFADESKAGFVHISSKSKYSTSVLVGDTYRSALIVRGDIFPDKIFAIIVNRGHIIHSEKIVKDNGIKIDITRDMTPTIRLVILAVTRSGELVSDSLKIDVFEDKCGFDMSIENDSKQALPGKKLNLYLNGSKGDSIALLAVDEAVYVLRDEDKLTKTKLMKELSKSDMGCGPGTGSDLNLVANNAGLKITTGESQSTADDSSGDEFCLRRKSTKRAKRDINNVLNIYTGFLRKCCLLGVWPTNHRRSCTAKADILKTFMPNEEQCYQAFLKCCRSYTTPLVAASVSNNNAFAAFDIDRTRTGSETEEYVHVAYEQDLEDKAFIRRDFRESWLFDIVVLNQSNQVLPITFPHSITTWALTGMSISEANGFCIMPSPLRLRTFQDIFIQISLPYSVVQNEQMEMIVTIFNYGSTKLPILVYTYGVQDICSEAEDVGQKTKKSLVVDPNSFVTVPFPMVPLKTGDYDIKVVALWSKGGDVVVRKLNVIPPGVPVEEDLTFQLDPKNRQRRSKRSIKTNKIEDEIISESSLQKTLVTVEPDITRNVVPGTRECIIAGIGDEFGATSYTTLSDIDKLIRKPKGCGEQTMLYMAPTLYTIMYLKSIDRLNGDLKYRGLNYIRNGYKRELSFRKDDGSFSAFPTRPSSVWLTAFVMKILCQASPFLIEDKFDPKVVENGLKWLIKEQKKDGSWTETHPVVHQLALGGVKGTVPLTAYVMIAFHECSRGMNEEFKRNRNFDNTINKSITKSESYLKQNQNEIIKQKNTYAMALVAYSLTFNSPQNAQKLVDALHSTANIDSNRNYKYWRHMYEVEATAYALMAIINSGNKNSLDALSISNWLNSVRSFSGSFSSTQDTIVALEALSQYIEHQKTPANSISLLCNITSHDMTASRFKRALSFTPENARILQTFKLDSDSSKLKFTTTGEGLGHMLVKLKYNVFEPPEVLCRFDLTIEVEEWKAPAGNRGSDEPPELDDNFFDDFKPGLVQTLDLRHKREKRSFWNPFRRRPNPSAKQHSERTESIDPNERAESFSQNNRLELNSNISDEHTFQKNNLSSNSITSSDGKSKLVLLIETCIRHIPRYYSDMSIIEVGILSGYKPNKDDLEEITKMEESLVSKYEISERNIVFYFEKVPFGRPYCIQFRKIQEHSVGNTQAAMVKVYDYYRNDHSCSQLYSPSRLTDYIETKCNSEVCECAKRENCPTERSVTEIGEIAEKRIVRARQLLEELICAPKYNYVFSGTFEKQNVTQNRFKFFELRVNSVFKGDLEKSDKFSLSLNPECEDSSMSDGKNAIIFGEFNKKVGHLNGSAIVYDISSNFKTDKIRNHILDLIKSLENKIKRENWSCP